MNQDLQAYITQARQEGKNDDQIRQELLSAGWQEKLVSQHLEISPRGSTPSNEILEKELSEHRSLDQEHIALDQEHADLDKKHLAIDEEHIAADKKHKKFDRWITVGSILAISLAGTALVFLDEYQLKISEYQSRVNDTEQKLIQQEGITAGQEQKLTQQQQDLDVLKKATIDIPTIIKEWEPRMAYIECYWDYIPNIQPKSDKRGSGLLLRITLPSGTIVYDVYTNKHVLRNLHGNAPNRCSVGFPPDFKEYSIANDSTNILWGDVEDWGIIKLSEDAGIVSIAASKIKVCQHPVALGEKILLLGYPGVGSKESVTSTEGIISGYDGYYYVTDAKFEQGSSGGAAISLKTDCYLGIPTRYELGEYESFGRILRSEFIPTTQ